MRHNPWSVVLTILLLERVLANVSASMARPRPDRPYEGTVTIHTELSPMASAIYETGRYVY
jgi:exosome complex RNA-binding protein Rrp42 (RNase PH superfamily)